MRLENKLADKDVGTILNLVWFALFDKETGADLNVHKKNTYIIETHSDFIIINTMHDAGKKFDGIGGVAALLRFKY